MKELTIMKNGSNETNFKSPSQSSIQKLSLDKIYRNKKVLVTGHTGFKGTWLSVWLENQGANVIGYSLEPNTQPSIFEATNLESKIIHVIGDIRNEKHLFDVFQAHKPEFVFHLAAQSVVRLSYQYPRLTYETNVIGLVNLLEAVRKTDSVRVVVNVTSDKCYENKEWFWGYRENDPMGGYDPYSSSKACSELVTEAYRSSFFNSNELSNHKIALASARSGNVIGGGDWVQDRIIPDCIRSLVEKKPITIRNPHSIRPWQHVLEPLSGYLWLGALLRVNRTAFSSAWNFGPENEQPLTVKELAEEVIKIWGKGSLTIQKNPHLQPHEAKYLKLDCSKANRMLKWFPIYDVKKAIKKTSNWYKLYYEGSKNAYDLCLKQIKKYISTARRRAMVWTSSLDISP